MKASEAREKALDVALAGISKDIAQNAREGINECSYIAKGVSKDFVRALAKRLKEEGYIVEGWPTDFTTGLLIRW